MRWLGVIVLARGIRMCYQGRVTAADQSGALDEIERVLAERGLRMTGVPMLLRAGEVDGLPWWEYCVGVEEARDGW